MGSAPDYKNRRCLIASWFAMVFVEMIIAVMDISEVGNTSPSPTIAFVLAFQCHKSTWKYKIARLEKMEHFSAELLMRPKGHKFLKHSCAELLKSCSYRTILRARHNVAVTRVVTLTPMQQIVFFVYIHFCKQWFM